jgi:hypothetical protein
MKFTLSWLKEHYCPDGFRPLDVTRLAGGLST